MDDSKSPILSLAGVQHCDCSDTPAGNDEYGPQMKLWKGYLVVVEMGKARKFARLGVEAGVIGANWVSSLRE